MLGLLLLLLKVRREQGCPLHRRPRPEQVYTMHPVQRAADAHDPAARRTAQDRLLPCPAQACAQERFHQLVPHLDRYSAVTVACTLIVIGVLGLKEVWEDTHQIPQPAVAGEPRAGSRQALVEGNAPSAAGSLYH